MFKIIALIGEAGSGKDSIMKRVLAIEPSLHEIVSCTSREPRENEIEGTNYYFYTKEGFENKIQKNEMLEYTLFNNWYYGTSYDSLSKEKINIGVFNPSGIRLLSKRNDIELITVYINRPAKLRLMGQLNREENPNVSEIARRVLADELDFSKLDFEYKTIYNETHEDWMNHCPQYIVSLLDKFR